MRLPSILVLAAFLTVVVLTAIAVYAAISHQGGTP
jgi:hypothetical protein